MHQIRFKKLRLWVAYVFAILYLVFAYQKGIDFIPGIWFVIGGLLIRFWAAGFIKKRRELTTAGPYAYVRNPLYLGNFLLGLGVCLFLKNPFVFLVFISLFFIFYLGTIKEEEVVLTELFAQQYLAYKKEVPALFPSFLPYKARKHNSFDSKLVFRNGEVIRILVTEMLLFSLYFFQYFYRENMWNKNKLWQFIFIYVFFLVLTIVSIVWRRRFLRQETNPENFSST